MTNEQIEYLKTIVKGRSVKEIQELLKKKFDTEFTKSHIAYIKNKYDIRSGPLGRFEKGHTPLRYAPIGSERIKNGHVVVKVAEPSIWKTKQRVIYEEKYGKIPEGHRIIFADGNKRNFDIENLILVSDSEALIMSTNGLMYEDAELTKTGSLIAKIIDKNRKLERKIVGGEDE